RSARRAVHAVRDQQAQWPGSRAGDLARYRRGIRWSPRIPAPFRPGGDLCACLETCRMTGETVQDSGCRIAVFIDDDPDVRAANAQTLELAGFDVRVFDGAEAALAQLDENFTGVVISDLRMPDVD